jgi:hypothetical protein
MILNKKAARELARQLCEQSKEPVYLYQIHIAFLNGYAYGKSGTQEALQREHSNAVSCISRFQYIDGIIKEFTN